MKDSSATQTQKWTENLSLFKLYKTQKVEDFKSKVICIFNECLFEEPLKLNAEKFNEARVIKIDIELKEPQKKPRKINVRFWFIRFGQNTPTIQRVRG